MLSIVDFHFIVLVWKTRVLRLTEEEVSVKEVTVALLLLGLTTHQNSIGHM